MPWATNPIFKSGGPTEKVDTDVEATRGTGGNGDRSGATTPDPPPLVKGDDDDSGIRPPTDKFTGHQIFYIFILDGIGAAFLSGGINFAIAFALYHNKGTHESPIRLFQFPNTLAGDTAVTIFVQFLVTWIIESILVNRDLKKGAVQPIGFIREPRWRFLRWFMFLDRREQTHEVRSLKHWLEYLYSQAVRSLILAVVTFPLIFGASIGFLTLVGERKPTDWDWYYSATWAPEVFKLVQGALLGLLFTPPMVMFWLARCGWALRENEGQSGS